MSTPIPKVVETYLRMIETDKPHRFCRRQHALAAYVRGVFRDEELRVDEERLRRYLSLAQYFPYRGGLMPWQEFCLALEDCTYSADGSPRWRTAFHLLGRGAGKDGTIAFDAFCLTSPYNPEERYDVDICANNEEQAMTPVLDIVGALETPRWEGKLRKHYRHTKEIVAGIRNKGRIRGRTNNPKGRDGMRSGKVVFNEVHAFQNYDNIKVFTTGLGKVGDPRIAIWTSNGDVSDGPLDDYLARSDRILFEGERDDGFLPFVCTIDSHDAAGAAEELADEENWYKANPSLAYFPQLLAEIRDEYRDWLAHPEQNGDFLTKRMGIRAGWREVSVTDYEKILATRQPLVIANGWSCTVGIDYAELSDWASVDFHFRRGDDRFDLSRSWICLQSKTLPRIRAPWQDWAKAGHLVPVEDVSIPPYLIAEYIKTLGKQYNIRMLGLDGYRWALMADALRGAGWDAQDRTRVKLVRPSDIMQVEPVIQECFDRGRFHWGDCPPLRWATNNTKRMRSAKRFGVETGNYIYAKIEPKSRKTDPFMALVAAMCCESALGSGAPARTPMAAIRL